MSEETTAPMTELQDLAAAALARLEPDEVGPVADYIVYLEGELAPWKQEFAPLDTLEVAKRIQDLEAEVRMACQDRDDRETKLGDAREALQPFIEHAEKRPMESHWTTWASFDDFAKARTALAPQEPGAKEPLFDQDALNAEEDKAHDGH